MIHILRYESIRSAHFEHTVQTFQWKEDLWELLSSSTGVYIVHFDHKKDACLRCLPRL